MEAGMRRFFNSLGNPFVSAVLRSPVHHIVSGKMALISVRGRRSGRWYTTPVEYRYEADTVAIATTQDRTWWRNLRGGALTRLLIRGQWLEGEGSAAPLGGKVEVRVSELHPAADDADGR
jgi:hypothetical protein